MHEQLDAAVAHSRITLVQGLPRVGRSSIVQEWARGRTDATYDGTLAVVSTPIVIIHDHASEADVDNIVASFRAGEQNGARHRHVVVPLDLATGERLRGALTGSVQTLDVCPLQLDDVLAAHTLLSLPAGPVTGIAAQSSATNAPAVDSFVHWLRGGLPESWGADSDDASLSWRRDMLNALLGRDYTMWGIPRGLWLPNVLLWAANQNGGELDDTACPGLKRADLHSALHVLDRLGLIRRLQNYPVGSTASMSKKPKLYIRDSGILHAMLGIQTIDQLRGYRLVGDSWEGYAIEALLLAGADRCRAQFYRAKSPTGSTLR